MLEEIVKFPPLVKLTHFHQRPVGFRGSFAVKEIFSLNQYNSEVDVRFGGSAESHHLEADDLVLMGPRTLRNFNFPRGGGHAVIHFEVPVSPSQISSPMIFRRRDTSLTTKTQLERIISMGPSPRANSLLWALLWDLKDMLASANVSDPSGDELAMELAQSFMRKNFVHELKVRDIVEASGLNHNRLTKLFRHRHGETIVAHLRRLRMESADKLLRHSDQSIKSIAVDVGIPNLQRFNKVFRHHYGVGPRNYRDALLRGKS